jgi:hypothetical protein
MAHGTPDYGVTAGAVTTYQLQDLGELAVRLGSPITHDRRGDVLWWDDFECGLAKWETVASGVGAAAALSTVRARNGRNSCLLTGGSDADRSVSITHRSPYPALSRLGLEMSFHKPPTIESLRLGLNVFTGSRRYRFDVMWDEAAQELRYRNAAGAFVAFATGVVWSSLATLFHIWKLVVDPGTLRYRRFIANDATYDLSAVAVEDAAVVGSPQSNAVVELISRVGVNDFVYVDDVILTQNEPA